MRRPGLAMLAVIFLAGAIPMVPAPAADTNAAIADPVGDWIGTLDAGSPVRVALHIKRVDGVLTGSADSPDQGAFGIVVSEITLDGDHLNFEIESIDGRYVSTWDATKRRYVGTWMQGGRMLALELGRGTYPPLAPLPGH